MTMSGPFTVGGVIRETFRIAGLNFWPFFAVALAVVEVPKWGGPILMAPTLAEFQRSAAAGEIPPIRAFLEGFVLGAAPGLVGQVGLVLLTGIVVKAAMEALAGRPADLSSCLRTGLATWPGNVALTLVYYACFLLGLVLLVVPGLVLSCMWAVFLPAHLAEGGPLMACFGRSRDLTSGYRWRIFFLTLVYGLVVGGVLGFLSGFAGGMASHGAPSGIVVVVKLAAALLGAAIAVVSAAGVTALYLRLRGAKEGRPGGDLAEAFS